MHTSMVGIYGKCIAKTARQGGAGNVSAKGMGMARRRPAASPWRDDKEARNNIISG